MTDKETFFDESYNIAQVEKPKFSDDYEILGDTTGGMGEVYFCREKRTGTLYALKQAKDDEKIRSLFEHEAAFALELDRHPNIVYTYTVGKEDGNYYIVMELIDSLRKEADVPHGRTLQDEFVRGAEIPLQTGYKWAVECCEGMEYLNAKGMAAHKDIKPANIFITKQGVAKIGDFGLVGLSKKMSGTPGYRAPEIKDGVFNVQSDIYAFGVVLYQLFNKGSNPLDKTFYTSAGTQMQFEGEDVFPRPETIRSRAAQAVIRKCLAQNPSERYASFKALQADLIAELKTLDPSYCYQPAELLPMTAKDFFKKGLGWDKLRDSKKELRCYNRAIELDPKYVHAYNNRGIVYKDLKEYDKALADYNKALELDPKYVNAYGNRGIVYKDLKEYDKALAAYTKAIELDPKSVYAYRNRGIVYKTLKEYDKALADYTKAIELDPEYVYAYNGRGNVYYALKEYDKALADYTKAIKLDPKNVDVYNNRGNVYEELKEYDNALADYTKAIELDPEYVYAYRNRGIVYKTLKEYDKALADYNKALELDPKYVAAYNSRGIVYKALKEYDNALADYTKAIELDPKYAYAYNNRGNVYDDLKEYDKALADYTKAIKLDPKYVYAYRNRGDFYKALKEYDSAAADYAKAIELNPRCSQYYDDLINLYEEMGELQKVEEIKALKASRGL